MLSTVAARSKIGQGLSSFCPAVILGGDNHAPLYLLGLLLEGLLDREWIKDNDIEASRAEYQSIVQQQRELERSSTSSRPDVGDVLLFCSSQAGFRARHHLLKVWIVTKMLKPCGDRFIITPDRVMICEDEVRGALLCVQDFVRSVHFTQ